MRELCKVPRQGDEKDVKSPGVNAFPSLGGGSEQPASFGVALWDGQAGGMIPPAEAAKVPGPVTLSLAGDPAASALWPFWVVSPVP